MTEKVLSQGAEMFLQERGLDTERLVQFGLHTVKKRGSDWLAIPYTIGGKAVNHKYRCLSEKEFEQDKNAVKCFWNQDALNAQGLDDQPIVITEGEFDAMAAIQAGYIRSVSVPDGAPAQEIGNKDSEKYSYLDLSLFSGAREIILAVDNDEPGTNLLNDLALRLGRASCKWVEYPLRRGMEGRCKDLNEVLKLYGTEGVRKTLKRAKWIKSDGVYAMSSLPPVVEQKGYQHGMGALNDLYIPRLGDFCVVTGIPGHGKSTFLNDLACRMAMRHGWRTAFASFEQYPQTDHRQSLRAWYYYETGEGVAAAADRWIDKSFRFMVPSDDDDPTLEWVVERCVMATVQHDCQMIVIDPWNEIDHLRDNRESLTEYVGKAIKRMKRLARQLNVHLIIAAHPAKMRKEDGQYLAPTMYDISDSAHWANKADLGISVYRKSVEGNCTEIAVLKARYYGVNGKPGVAQFSFNRTGRRYVET